MALCLDADPMPIPPFDTRGMLPRGDHSATIGQLRRSRLVTGVGVAGPWDAAWRRRLVQGLAHLAGQLWEAGIEEVFVDGSFVEDKAHPNDIDGYFVCPFDLLRTGELQRRLNAMDSGGVWTWDPASRRMCLETGKLQLPMWHAHRVELYPHVPGLGIGCGIRDEHGNELEFPAAFRRSRSGGQPRGIIALRRSAL